MRCGAKCFFVEIETSTGVKTKRVNARTPAGARKAIRAAYEDEILIKSVLEKKRT